MGATSLLLYLRDRGQLSLVVTVAATLLVVLGLLAFGAILDTGTVDSSPADGRFLAPFRWEPMERNTLG